MPNFTALGIYFLLGTNFSGNEKIDSCFNVECMLLCCNIDFLGGYLVVTARYIVVAARYCSLPCSYCPLPLIKLSLPTFSMKGE